MYILSESYPNCEFYSTDSLSAECKTQNKASFMGMRVCIYMRFMRQIVCVCVCVTQKKRERERQYDTVYHKANKSSTSPLSA